MSKRDLRDQMKMQKDKVRKEMIENQNKTEEAEETKVPPVEETVVPPVEETTVPSTEEITVPPTEEKSEIPPASDTTVLPEEENEAGNTLTPEEAKKAIDDMLGNSDLSDLKDKPEDKEGQEGQEEKDSETEKSKDSSANTTDEFNNQGDKKTDGKKKEDELPPEVLEFYENRYVNAKFDEDWVALAETDETYPKKKENVISYAKQAISSIVDKKGERYELFRTLKDGKKDIALRKEEKTTKISEKGKQEKKELALKQEQYKNQVLMSISQGSAAFKHKLKEYITQNSIGGPVIVANEVANDLSVVTAKVVDKMNKGAPAQTIQKIKAAQKGTGKVYAKIFLVPKKAYELLDRSQIINQETLDAILAEEKPTLSYVIIPTTKLVEKYTNTFTGPVKEFEEFFVENFFKPDSIEKIVSKKPDVNGRFVLYTDLDKRRVFTGREQAPVQRSGETNEQFLKRLNAYQTKKAEYDKLIRGDGDINAYINSMRMYSSAYSSLIYPTNYIPLNTYEKIRICVRVDANQGKDLNACYFGKVKPGMLDSASQALVDLRGTEIKDSIFFPSTQEYSGKSFSGTNYFKVKEKDKFIKKEYPVGSVIKKEISINKESRVGTAKAVKHKMGSDAYDDTQYRTLKIQFESAFDKDLVEPFPTFAEILKACSTVGKASSKTSTKINNFDDLSTSDILAALSVSDKNVGMAYLKSALTADAEVEKITKSFGVQGKSFKTVTVDKIDFKK